MRASLTLVIFSLLAASALSAFAAPATAASPKEEPAVVEEVAGSQFPHLVLKPRAVERLGIQTTVARSSLVTRKRIVAARILDREHRLAVRDGAGSAIGDPVSNLLRVLPIWDAAAISPELPARIVPVSKRDAFEPQPAKYLLAPGKAEEGALYYEVGDAGKVLKPGQRVLVELSYRPVRRTAVAFGAVFYDASGGTWIYEAVAPFTYVRHAVTIGYVEDNMAFLDEGLPDGTDVVTQGAPLLAGIETKVGH